MDTWKTKLYAKSLQEDINLAEHVELLFQISTERTETDPSAVFTSSSSFCIIGSHNAAF